MKFNVFVLLSIANFNLFAAEAVIDGHKLDCAKSENTQGIFHCKNGQEDILITNMGYGYSAYSKNSKNILSMRMVESLKDGDQVLYETKPFPGFGGLGGGMMGYGGNLTIVDTKANRHMLNSAIANNLKLIDDPMANDFVGIANENLAKEKPASKVKFETKSGKSFECKQGATRELREDEKKYQSMYNIKISCNYFVCENDKKQKALAFVPDSSGSMSAPAILTFDPKGKEELTWNGIKVSSLEAEEENLPIYQTPQMPAYGMGGYPGGAYPAQTDQSKKSDALSNEDFLPTKIKENITLYNSIASPEAASAIEYNSSLCTDDETKALLAKQKELASEMQASIITENLSHLLTLMDGKVVGALMPTASVSKYGCLYNGVYITPKAFSHLNYINRINEKNEQKYLSITEAQDLFKKAAMMDDIPFGYKYDGCYARAHVMARRFEAMGIPTEKVWIKGDLSVPGTDIRWNFHVAPVITVIGPNDTVPQKYVIDPSLEDKAVPLDEWGATMKANVKGPVVKTSYPFPLNAAMMERTAVALSSSEPYLPMEDENTSEEQKMQMAFQTMKDYSAALKSATK